MNPEPAITRMKERDLDVEREREEDRLEQREKNV